MGVAQALAERRRQSELVAAVVPLWLVPQLAWALLSLLHHLELERL